MALLIHERPQEREDLRAELLQGSSFLVLAPRRVGKTWLMKRLAEDMTEEGWLCITIDLQGKTEEEQFLRELCQKIEETKSLKARVVGQIGQRFRQAAAGWEDGNLADVVGEIDHREFLDALVKSLNEEDRPTLILIDELALFIQALVAQNVDQAKSLLYHLRKLMQAYPNVRWFLTGSVGLDAISRQHGIEGGLLGIELFPLEPFTREEAESFIEEMNAQRRVRKPFSFANGAFDYLIDELGWLSPYYIEHVVKLIRPDGDPPTASRETVESGFARILHPSCRTHFAGWDEHIDKNYPRDEAERMSAIVDMLCDDMAGETETTIMTRLEQMLGQGPSARQLKNALIGLESDAYIHRDGERWRFRSGLLRRFWLEYCQS